MNEFFTTKWGSFVKAFLGVVLAYLLANGGDILSLGNRAWLGAFSASLAAFFIKWLTGATSGFFNTWYGNLLKTFVLVGLAYIVKQNGLIGLNWGALLNAGVVAVLTVIVNGSNKYDKRYGLF